MKNTLIVAAILTAMIASPFALTASAANVNVGTAVTSVGTSVGVQLAARFKTAQNRADQEITRRIDALNNLTTRVNAMVKLSADEKASLSSEIQAQIAAMNTLQAQIAADIAADATSSLKTDVQSITKSYRIFMLIIPQGALDAAADRVLNVANMMTTLARQLQARGAASSTLADMNAKIADANVQANAAISEIANLKPDNGDKTVATANLAAMKDARSKVQAGQQDLVAARKDATAIAKALRISANASGTVKTSGTE